MIKYIIGDTMKILCIGHAAYDITLPVGSYPLENTKNRVSARMECGGGPASNAAYLLGKWGMDVYFAGMVGDDEYGKRIKEEFDVVSVKTQYLEFSKAHKTTASFIIASQDKGTRTILTYKPSDMVMSDFELDFEPNVILMDGQEIVQSKKLIEKYPNAITIIDAGRPTAEIVELAQMVNYVVCSKEFAETVTNITINYDDHRTIVALFNKMEKLFKGEIVVTLEAKGCLYKKADQIRIMPSINVIPVDSTGAGDIFHGAFTYGIARNLDIEHITKISNIAGALSVTKLGGRYSVPTKEEMKKVLAEFK
jgi:sulfofructose kinase